MVLLLTSLILLAPLPLTNVPPGGPFNFGNPLLLTDGTVIIHRTDTPDWYKLTPNAAGSYIDGTWSKIGATHGESITQMGDPKLLLTSYVTWSLLESGCKDASRRDRHGMS